eukprot:g44368.t1
MADTISLVLRSSLEHLDNKDTYVRLLIIDFSCAFNTIIPTKLIFKPRDPGVCSAPATGSKMKELVIEFRKWSGGLTSVCINDAELEVVKSFKFLGVNISKALSWSIHINATVEKAHEHLYFFRRLRKFG